jgi:hypothetical protein
MEFEKYIYNKPKPTPPTKPILKGQTPRDHREYADRLEIFEGEKMAYDDKLARWYEGRSGLFRKFKEDLIKEAGIAHLPRACQIFDFAWNHCSDNDNPYEDTYSFIMDMVALFPIPSVQSQGHDESV